MLPGDFPDPSVSKWGRTYWATATSSNWAPAFPLLKSTDLRTWELVGHVFPGEPPAWADYYFWAPEISFDRGQAYVYYTAHRRGGALCVAAARADRPEGPYTDLGPLVEQPAGSIDGFAVRDEHGRLYLVWKEDGNSRNQPTPIWAQPLREDRTGLLDRPVELFRNDQPWEGNLVEGVSIVRRAGYFYAFYAGNGCCGRNCTYGLGVARARSLLGPWEKYPHNPVLRSTDAWKCPGHGTAVEHGGRWFLLHHAYRARGWEYVGRQGVLSEFRWSAAGWPEFGPETTAAAPALAAPTRWRDDFRGARLNPAWQWPVLARPRVALRGGRLHLTARPDGGGAALGRSIAAADFTATTTLLNPQLLPAGTSAGLAVLGDTDNALALTAGGGALRLWQRQKGRLRTLAETALPATNAALTLRLQVVQGKECHAAWSTDGGRTWQPLATAEATDGSFLPPWDRGVRAGLLALGLASVTASFEDFALENQFDTP
ncbi:family 43 glycosylhydrolase [Hymenobacter sp. 15J16-1T3B]|uniref:family 43 glycosylhydrolase n=1 Tax=Hymenobacter sp. 15J16-1T3B TaxID=2886941 RepID=UPI00293EE33F|nr:family 43 glycosylhydrolase [Hymenobacter sp. 15J16-1T3B]